MICDIDTIILVFCGMSCLRVGYLFIVILRFAKQVFISRGAFENAVIVPRFHITCNM